MAKLAKKATMKAMYLGWAQEGSNKKSKRHVRKKRFIVKSSKHANIENCGNAGCSRCNPSLNTDYLGKLGKNHQKLVAKLVRNREW